MRCSNVAELKRLWSCVIFFLFCRKNSHTNPTLVLKNPMKDFQNICLHHASHTCVEQNILGNFKAQKQIVAKTVEKRLWTRFRLNFNLTRSGDLSDRSHITAEELCMMMIIVRTASQDAVPGRAGGRVNTAGGLGAP